jgi:hypothetical protein
MMFRVNAAALALHLDKALLKTQFSYEYLALEKKDKIFFH